MSQNEETQVAGREEAVQETGHEAPSRKSLFLSWLPFVVGLVAGILAGWAVMPPLLYSTKPQPFNFNHLAHTEGAGMECDECHMYGGDGRFSGVPDFEYCLMCHTWSDRQNEESKAETLFLEKFVNEDDELIRDENGNQPQWRIYSRQPDCVYFSHIAHTENGGLSCEECHGDHGKTSGLRPYRENRITRYPYDVDWDMKMTDCGDCHEEQGKPENNACFVCHK